MTTLFHVEKVVGKGITEVQYVARFLNTAFTTHAHPHSFTCHSLIYNDIATLLELTRSAFIPESLCQSLVHVKVMT